MCNRKHICVERGICVVGYEYVSSNVVRGRRVCAMEEEYCAMKVDYVP